MARFLYLIIIILILISGCNNYQVEKQHILSAEKLIEESPEQAKEELDHIPEIDYFRMSPKWQARYTYVRCRVADRLETEFPLAIEINTAREWYIKKGKVDDIVALSLFLGRAYMAEKDDEQAMKAFLDGLDRAEKASLINAAGYLNSYLADLYTQNNHIETALAKYKEAADCFLKAGNLRSYGFAQRDMGFSYEMLELYNDALAATTIADSIGKVLNDSLIRSTALNGFGNIYLSMGEYDQAIDYLLSKSHETGHVSFHDQMTLCEIYIEADQLTKARQILDGLSQYSIPEMFKRGVYYYYYKIHSKEGNDKEALYNFEQFYHLIEKRLDELEDYNYIEIEKKYNHLNLAMQIKELTIGKQRNLLFISLLILLVLVITAIYLYRQIRTSKQLANQEKQINESQRKIVNLTRELEKKKERIIADEWLPTQTKGARY